MYSPSISAIHLPLKGAFFDPYRYSHLNSEKLMKDFDPHWEELREVLTFNIESCYPDFQMRGGEEYMTRLDENFLAAFHGTKTPEKAMKETEDLWEEITKRYGRDSQKEQWKTLKSCYGASLRKALHFPDPPDWISKLV